MRTRHGVAVTTAAAVSSQLVSMPSTVTDGDVPS
jgi:hypothetical protein